MADELPDPIPGAYVWFVGGNRRHSTFLYPSDVPGKTHWAKAPDIAGAYDVQVYWPGQANPLGGQRTVATQPGDVVQFQLTIEGAPE